jgi:hypothetical protein
VLCPEFYGENEDTHGKPPSVYLVTTLRFEPDASCIQNYSISVTPVRCAWWKGKENTKEKNGEVKTSL